MSCLKNFWSVYSSLGFENSHLRLKILWIFSNSKWKFLFYWTSPKKLQKVQKEEMESLSTSILWYKQVSKTNTGQGDMLNLHFWVWWLKIEFLLFLGFWAEVSEDSWLGLEVHLLLYKITLLGSCLSSFSLRNKPNIIFLFVILWDNSEKGTQCEAKEETRRQKKQPTEQIHSEGR